MIPIILISIVDAITIIRAFLRSAVLGFERFRGLGVFGSGV